MKALAFFILCLAVLAVGLTGCITVENVTFRGEDGQGFTVGEVGYDEETGAVAKDIVVIQK